MPSSSCALSLRRKKQRKEAERRQTRIQPAVLLTRPRAQQARTPIGVPPRLLPEGDLLPKALLQAMFPGTRRSVILLHPPSDGRTSAVLAGVTRPNLSQPSEHLALRSLVPED